MKITTRKIELTIEKSETVIVCDRKTIFVQCAKCGREVQMLSPETATRFMSISSLAIYGMITANQIHFVETVNGQILVCLDSLLQIISQTKVCVNSEEINHDERIAS